jgi:flagellin-like hook-associated protein FlgL
MSTAITLTAAVRANLLALQNTTANQATTQQRLATGKKVNSALDNPTNFFTAAALSSRAGQLTNLLDSMTNGVNTLKAADNGLTSITTSIQSMQATVTQARQDASWQSASYSLDSSTIGTSSLKTIGFSGGAVTGSVTVSLNDQETLSGATTGFTSGAGSNTAGTSGTLTIQASDINGGTAVTVSVNTADVVSTVAANINTAAGYTLASVVSGELKLQDAGPNKITVTGSAAGVITGTGLAASGTTATSSAAAGAVESVDQIVSAINSNASLSGNVKASNNAGQLQITNLSISALTVTGVGTSGKVDGSTGTNTVAGNSVRGNLVSQFNQLKDQLDKTAQDASFNGINLLNGDALKLFFNENSTSSLTIQSTNTAGVNSTTLSIGSATNAEFQANSSLDTRLQTLSTALTSVASQASAFGSNLSIVQNRQDFTNNMVNTLQVGSDGLTLADTNLEGANMMALQTRQQLSITALSLASQANQAVLRLFG